MGTYADYFNQHYDGSRSSGPVRVTISRGERLAVDPQTGHTYWPDTWHDEELMEFEADADGPAGAPAAPGTAEARAPPPFSGAHPVPHADTRLGAALVETLAGTPAFVWVLDTNTLLSSLDLLSSMFRELLSLAARRPTAPPLLVFVVPHVVLGELDALKNANSTMQCTTAAPHLVRRTVQVGTAARDASRWLLASVQDQKYTMGISKPQWPLQVQTTSDALAGQTAHLTNDQAIVSLCVSLTQNTHARVVLVSDDTNARMHAESEGLPTTSPEELYRVLPRNRAAAQQLLMLSSSPEHRDLICHPRALAALAPSAWEHLDRLWDSLAGAVAPAGPEEAMIE